MIKWNPWTAIALLLCGAVAGCISTDYVGQSFPELPPGTYIAFFDRDQDLPENTYKMIGQARLTGGDSSDPGDFRDKLMSLAEENGADAIKITRSTRVLTEEFVESLGNSNYEPASVSGIAGPGLAGPQIGSFGEPLPEQRERVKRYKTVVDAQLLVRISRFNTVMAERRAEREAQFQASKPAATAEAQPEAKPIEPGTGNAPEPVPATDDAVTPDATASDTVSDDAVAPDEPRADTPAAVSAEGSEPETK